MKVSPFKVSDKELAARIKLAAETKVKRAAAGKTVLMTVQELDELLDPMPATRYPDRLARKGKPLGSSRGGV